MLKNHAMKKQKRSMNRKNSKEKSLKRKKRSRRKFEEIRVGYLLSHHAPIEYAIIIDSCGQNNAPSADLIEKIGYISSNGIFKTALFRRALIDYRENGLHCNVAFGCRKKHKTLINKSF